MPRNSKDKMPRDNEGQEEMTVVILRFKGGSQSLQKGFDTVSQALAALGESPVVHHRKLPAIAVPSTEIHEASDDGNTGGVQRTEGASESDPTEREEHPQRIGGGERRYKKPSFLDDLNLNPPDVTGWKEYSEQKNPQGANQQYLVAAAWLATCGGHETFTDDHLFTCFRAMRWNGQRDFMQPVRQMKQKQSYFEKLGSGQWKLTSVGLDAAQRISDKAE